MIGIVGKISFDNRELNVYSSLEEPLFRASDVCDILDYSSGNTWNMLNLCEEDEKLTLPIVVAGQKRSVSFVTEVGLYNILSQSRKTTARKWRRIIHNEIVDMRKKHSLDIIEQFDEWDSRLGNVFIDPETGRLMESITVAGGDVEQIPYRGKLN